VAVRLFWRRKELLAREKASAHRQAASSEHRRGGALDSIDHSAGAVNRFYVAHRCPTLLSSLRKVERGLTDCACTARSLARRTHNASQRFNYTTRFHFAPRNFQQRA